MRAHNQIELLEDRLYQITCGKAGFQNSRDTISFPQLKVTDNYGIKKSAVLEGSQYTMEMEVLNHDPTFGTLIKSCVAFDNLENSNYSARQMVSWETQLLDFSRGMRRGLAASVGWSQYCLRDRCLHQTTSICNHSRRSWPCTQAELLEVPSSIGFASGNSVRLSPA